MPDKYVFPGGKTDRDDHRLKVTADLRSSDRDRLFNALGTKASEGIARAIAMSAVRETHEETGLLLLADLSLFRLIARAVTPPVYRHRYDTHFFAAFGDEAVAEASPPLASSGELLDPGWFTFEQAKGLALPEITRAILHDIEARLAFDPALKQDSPIPCYQMLQGKMLRKMY